MAIVLKKPVIRASGTTDASLRFDATSQIIIGDDDGTSTMISSGPNSYLLYVTRNSSVEVDKFTFTGNPGNQALIQLLVSIPGGGDSSKVTLRRVYVQASPAQAIYTTGGELVLDRSEVARNADGLQLSQTKFTIVNSIIAANGSSLTHDPIIFNDCNGNVYFSTIFANSAQNDGVHSGVSCLGNIVFDSVLLQENVGNQFDGTGCTFKYSSLWPITSVPPGVGNLTGNALVDNNTFHLMPTSPVRDMANPASNLDVDFDGDSRPQGNARDIGADELMP